MKYPKILKYFYMNIHVKNLKKYNIDFQTFFLISLYKYNIYFHKISKKIGTFFFLTLYNFQNHHYILRII